MTTTVNTTSVRHRRAGRFFLCLAALLTASCTQEPIKLSGEAQGTYYSIIYYDKQGRDLQPQVDSLLDAFDLTASLWVDSSLLRRLNAGTTDSVNSLFADLLSLSQSMSEYTGGAFDTRIGRIVQAWGFSFRQQEEPDSSELAAMLDAARAGVSVSNGRLVKESPATELDFNAIAQGYSVDLLAAMFDSLGIGRYLIDVGGEVIARGTKADGSAWRVGVERPAADSVSVVDSTAWRADAMATAYMVMGLDRGRQFIAAHPQGPGTAAVLFIYDSCGTLCTYTTPGFDKITLKQ